MSEIAPVLRSGRSFADQAEQELRRQIITGRRRPGDRLNEVEIASDLGVSRGPVREAMQRLARDGLVHVEAHRGAFVRALDGVDITRLYEVRTSLECTAAELAAQRRTPADVERLQSLLDSTTAQVSRQEQPHYPTELDIHQLIALTAGNERLHRLIVQINQELTLARSASGSRPRRAERALAEHTEIVEAIERGAAGAARELMTAHLRRSLANTLRIVADAQEPA